MEQMKLNIISKSNDKKSQIDLFLDYVMNEKDNSNSNNLN